MKQASRQAKRPAPDRRRQALAVLDILRCRYPEARCELEHVDPLELTVAVVLSAQCTDLRVNQVTGELFRRCRTPRDYLELPAGELEELIRPVGCFRRKADSLRGIMRGLLAHHGGQVPADLDALVALPGIGRKTANVIIGNAFGIAAGIAVDTHVGRVARRLGLTAHADPAKVEADLVALFPQEAWIEVNHLLIFHGRQICVARRPRCPICPLAELCDFRLKACLPAGRQAERGRTVKDPLPDGSDRRSVE